MERQECPIRACVEEKIKVMLPIREILFANRIVSPWPYDPRTPRPGRGDTEKSKIPAFDSWPKMSLLMHTNLGRGAELFLRKRLKKATSQGRIFVSVAGHLNTETVVLIKVNDMKRSHVDMWPGPGRSTRHVPGVFGGAHLVMSSAFMDALCYLDLSSKVEDGTTPHFPVCVGAGLANVSRNGTDGPGSPATTIWMEYVPISMAVALEKQPVPEGWWSALWQVECGALIAKHFFDVVHNDLHSENVRARTVPKNSYLRYVSSDGLVVKVPTLGKLYVIIDFGRCCSAPWKDDLTVASSEFYEGETCSGMNPDNGAADFVRLVVSLEDKLETSIPEGQPRKELMDFFRECCEVQTSGSNYNILDTLMMLESQTSRNDAALWNVMEAEPKTNCTKTTPEWCLRRMLGRFEVSEHSCSPSSCSCYPIPIKLRT